MVTDEKFQTAVSCYNSGENKQHILSPEILCNSSVM
jgi:hypothetical protein